jgi:hypothetical protein
MPDEKIPVPTPRPDPVKAVIEETFGELVRAAVRLGVIPPPAVNQDMDEWLGAEVAGQFKAACASVLLTLL